MQRERTYGEQTAFKVDQEVSSILKNAYERVKNLAYRKPWRLCMQWPNSCLKKKPLKGKI